MEHDGAVLCAVLADVGHVKLLRHLEVELDRAALPGTADAVLEVEVDLRAVEGAVAGVEFVGRAGLLERLFEALFGEIPELRVAHRVLGARGELHIVFKAEYVLIDVAVQLHDRLYFVFYLLGRAVDVSVVLCKGAHAHEAVQRAGTLVAVDEAELRHAQRQFAVAVDVVLVDENAAGAVHRLHGERRFVYLREVHVLFIVVPVARLEPQ